MPGMPAMLMSYEITDVNIGQIRQLKEGGLVTLVVTFENETFFNLTNITKR